MHTHTHTYLYHAIYHMYCLGDLAVTSAVVAEAIALRRPRNSLARIACTCVCVAVCVDHRICILVVVCCVACQHLPVRARRSATVSACSSCVAVCLPRSSQCFAPLEPAWVFSLDKHDSWQLKSDFSNFSIYLPPPMALYLQAVWHWTRKKNKLFVCVPMCVCVWVI